MTRNGIPWWWIVPALLVVFLVAAVVTFTGEPKSNYVQEAWKRPTSFVVLSADQIVGEAHAAARVDVAVHHAKLNACTENRAVAWRPVSNTCRVPSAMPMHHLV